MAGPEISILRGFHAPPKQKKYLQMSSGGLQKSIYFMSKLWLAFSDFLSQNWELVSFTTWHFNKLHMTTKA